ncbi:hypothetical protein [uncultured Winogradskyella sp.]|nr:hypothetical protein [uncultured Winogradskyella sp.]
MDKDKNGKNFRINDKMVGDKISKDKTNDKNNDGNKNGNTFEINDSSAK